MKNKILAICDPEEIYAERLMEYLNEKQSNPFYVRAFSSLEMFESFLEQEEAEILLIAAELAAEDMHSRHTGKRILLTEGRVALRQKGEPAIYKYQSAEKIIREVLYYYAEGDHPFLQAALLREEVQLLGVYAPVHRIGKTTFAWALGTACAEKSRTLYLNLEPCSGFAGLLPMAGEWNLGDLLYYLKKKKQGFLYKLKSVTQSRGNLDYIAPVLSAEDLLAVSEEEWEELLERLITDAGYETIILDLSECVRGLPELLEKCTCVYMPVREDLISAAKQDQFERMLKEKGFGDVTAVIRRIQLPPVRREGEAPFEGCPEEWSGLMKEWRAGKEAYER